MGVLPHRNDSPNCRPWAFARNSKRTVAAVWLDLRGSGVELWGLISRDGGAKTILLELRALIVSGRHRAMRLRLTRTRAEDIPKIDRGAKGADGVEDDEWQVVPRDGVQN